MDRLDFNVFFAKLTEGKSIDEPEFCFPDDPEETSRWLGCIAGKDMPYWVGGCDIPAGAVFRTAQELADGIRDGDISVSPAEMKGWNACQWCEYAAVCGVDPTRPGCTKRVLPHMKRQELLARLANDTDEEA